MKAFSLMLALIAGVSVLTASAVPVEVDGVKGVVSAQVVTYSEVEVFTLPARMSLERQYPAGGPTFEQKLGDALDDGLHQLVDRQLILHSFETDGYKLPDSVIEEIVQEKIRERYGDRVTFMKSLQRDGMTVEQFRKQVRDQYIESAMRSVNVTHEIFISPYKVEQYYLAHTNDFGLEDQVKLRLIALNKSGPDDTNTIALAREILAKIKDGAPFAEMASIHSQGSQRQQGGDLGWEKVGTLRQEFKDAIATLKTGQVSEPVDTGEAINLLFVEDLKVAHVRPLSEVAVEIENVLRLKEQARLQKQWLDRLKKKTFIRYIR